MDQRGDSRPPETAIDRAGERNVEFSEDRSESEMNEKCGAVKHGVVDLQCEEDRGHDEPKDGLRGTWHEATLVDQREVTYPGARHLIDSRETVSWEPVDHAAEATRHLMAGRKRPREIADSASEALDAQSLHDSPGSDL
jgi:hypothetical protein